MSTRANAFFYIAMALQALNVIAGFVLVGTFMPAQSAATMSLVNLMNMVVLGVHCYALIINANESAEVARWPVVVMTNIILMFTLSMGIIADTRTGYFIHAEDVTYAVVTALIVLLAFWFLRRKPAGHCAN